MMGKSEEKVEEDRYRRMADRRGLDLHKSRRRDRQAPDFGVWTAVDRTGGSVVYEGRWPWLKKYIDDMPLFDDGRRSS